MSEQTVFSEEEAGAILHLSRMELYRRRESGELGYCQVGRRVLYLKRHLDDFLAQKDVSARNKKPVKLPAQGVQKSVQKPGTVV